MPKIQKKVHTQDSRPAACTSRSAAPRKPVDKPSIICAAVSGPMAMKTIATVTR